MLVQAFLKFGTKLILQSHNKKDWNPCFSQETQWFKDHSFVQKIVLDWKFFKSLSFFWYYGSNKDFKNFQCVLGGWFSFQTTWPMYDFYQNERHYNLIWYWGNLKCYFSRIPELLRAKFIKFIILKILSEILNQIQL